MGNVFEESLFAQLFVILSSEWYRIMQENGNCLWRYSGIRSKMMNFGRLRL